MYTLRPEEWSIHYSLCAVCGVRCEKNLDVQTKVYTYVHEAPFCYWKESGVGLKEGPGCRSGSGGSAHASKV